MGTAKWLEEVYELINNSETENKGMLLIRWAAIATNLGYEIEFRDNQTDF